MNCKTKSKKLNQTSLTIELVKTTARNDFNNLVEHNFVTGYDKNKIDFTMGGLMKK